MNFEQRSFVGGSNLLDADTALAEDQYRMVINGRTRFKGIQPVLKSIHQSTLPDGNYQGGISVGNMAIVFIDGLAYYQAHGNTYWLQIANFSMDAVAPRLWSIAIPKSDRDYLRQAVNSANEPIVINPDVTISGNPAGILVQDNIHQAWLIQFNNTSQTFVARVTKTFAQWANTSNTANDREYIPIGNQMFFLNQKLYIVARDKKSLYHSITGRPLDFMVNIDVDGNKLSNETDGGASSVSFAFDGDEITCIKPVNSPDSFLYGTLRNVRIIQLDYTKTILGEPTYTQSILVEVGVVNSESAIDILGDYALCDNDGVKSFNAAASIYVEGRNSIFSLQVASLLEGINQTEPASIKFNNYALFYVETTMGQAILVYDELREHWASIDITTVVGIKQFFTLRNGSVDKLYAVCNDKLWLMYSSDESEMCQVYFKALTPDNGKAEHKGQYFKPIFRGGTLEGTVRVIEYSDERISSTLTRTMPASIMGIPYPIRTPVVPCSIPNMEPPTFILNDGQAGKKLSYILLWNTNALLQAVKIQTSEQDGDAASRQLSI